MQGVWEKNIPTRGHQAYQHTPHLPEDPRRATPQQLGGGGNNKADFHTRGASTISVFFSLII